MVTLADEIRLVKRARDDPAAFAPIYEHYLPRVYNFVFYQVQDVQIAEDLTAQIFAQTLAQLERYRPERGTFPSWLFGIARNHVRKHWRRQRLRRWLPLEAADRATTRQPLPDEIAAHNERLAQLLPLIRSLRKRERQLLALKFGAGLTNREIAAIMGLSAGNVGVILYRTVKGLREAVAGTEQ